MTQAERIRAYYRENPNAHYKEVAEALGIKENNVKANISRDVKHGLAVRTENGGVDYEYYFKAAAEKEDYRDYSKTILTEQIELIREANRRETDSNQIRLNAREIRSLLHEVGKL